MTFVFMCDVCQEPILGPNAGIMVWLREVEPSGDGRPRVSRFASVHKGRCDDVWRASTHLEGTVDQWEDLDVVGAQLVHHANHELEVEPDVVYVAAVPSRWRRPIV